MAQDLTTRQSQQLRELREAGKSGYFVNGRLFTRDRPSDNSDGRLYDREPNNRRLTTNRATRGIPSAHTDEPISAAGIDADVVGMQENPMCTFISEQGHSTRDVTCEGSPFEPTTRQPISDESSPMTLVTPTIGSGLAGPVCAADTADAGADRRVTRSACASKQTNLLDMMGPRQSTKSISTNK